MQNTQNNQLDKWEETLEIELKNLKECQSKKQVDSCIKCELIIGCTIRKKYVNAVYQSMNKGQGGGFEF